MPQSAHHSTLLLPARKRLLRDRRVCNVRRRSCRSAGRDGQPAKELHGDVSEAPGGEVDVPKAPFTNALAQRQLLKVHRVLQGWVGCEAPSALLARSGHSAAERGRLLRAEVSAWAGDERGHRPSGIPKRVCGARSHEELRLGIKYKCSAFAHGDERVHSPINTARSNAMTNARTVRSYRGGPHQIKLPPCAPARIRDESPQRQLPVPVPTTHNLTAKRNARDRPGLLDPRRHDAVHHLPELLPALAVPNNEAAPDVGAQQEERPPRLVAQRDERDVIAKLRAPHELERLATGEIPRDERHRAGCPHAVAGVDNGANGSAVHLLRCRGGGAQRRRRCY
mmetsp:Transcript_27181/g.89123  ORF Transcript_27181/g.89123 Transcript_27181/m.89123 type:complete len:338 (+) Transcript_27181:1239-2252(+)